MSYIYIYMWLILVPLVDFQNVVSCLDMKLHKNVHGLKHELKITDDRKVGGMIYYLKRIR